MNNLAFFFRFDLLRFDFQVHCDQVSPSCGLTALNQKFDLLPSSNYQHIQVYIRPRHGVVSEHTHHISSSTRAHPLFYST